MRRVRAGAERSRARGGGLKQRKTIQNNLTTKTTPTEYWKLSENTGT
jgi:hypothetical protein